MSLSLHEIAERGHRILDPFTDTQLMELAAVACVGPGTRVLDLACGKGEMLCRWALELGSTGVGVDLSEAFVGAARLRASELGVADRVDIQAGDAADYTCAPASFDVAACLGATWIGGGVGGTIDLLRRAVTAEGLLLVGEPFWHEQPPPAAVEAISPDPDEFTDLPGLLGTFHDAGTELVEMVTADHHSWDRYVAAQWWTLRQWLADHPGDPQSTEVRAFLDESRRTYLTYQRRYLGWGVFALRAAR